MAELQIFQQGDKAKCIITSRNPHLDMENCDFYVELRYGMMGQKMVIQKPGRASNVGLLERRGAEGLTSS